MSRVSPRYMGSFKLPDDYHENYGFGCHGRCSRVHHDLVRHLDLSCVVLSIEVRYKEQVKRHKNQAENDQKGD